jgi:regulator of extracellular matrix RemA (YlzA/DUF370 family)
MYIHLGDDMVISAIDVVAILNIEEPISADLKDIIEIAEIEKKLVIISKTDKKKSLIVCKDKCYISPISSNTLYKRASHYPKEV